MEEKKDDEKPLDDIKNHPITFDQTINSLRPIYYHLLDGYLNPYCGSSISIVRNIIVDFKLWSHKLANNITFLEISDNYIILYNILNKKEIYRIDIDQLIERTNKKNRIDDILKHLEYCIYHVVNDNHATSIVIECKKILDKTICKVSCFNSGAGVDLHESIIKNKIKYYKPNKTFILSDNFLNGAYDNLKKLLIILLLPSYYKIVKTILNLQHHKITVNYNNKAPFYLVGDYYSQTEVETFSVINIQLKKLGYEHEHSILNITLEYNNKKYTLDNYFPANYEYHKINSNLMKKILPLVNIHMIQKMKLLNLMKIKDILYMILTLLKKKSQIHIMIL